MKIKICGLRDAENIKAVAALQPDLVGFICYERSPRFIADMDADILSTISPEIQKTAVFVEIFFVLVAVGGVGADAGIAATSRQPKREENKR